MAIDKLLAFDCETTGFTFGPDPSKDHCMVSAGLIVADLDFNPIEELYVEIKWDGKSNWADQAENIHGLSRQYLEAHGQTHEQAAEAIGGLLVDHFGFDKAITLLGTNVMSFDLFFIRKFLDSMELSFKFSHRGADTFSLAIGTVKSQTSDELFELLGFDKRDKHNALEDARMSLKAFKIINNLWSKHVG